jgi:hypothetical protein
MKSVERTVPARGNPPNQSPKVFQGTAQAVDAAGDRKSCPTKHDRAFRTDAAELQPALPPLSRRAEAETMNQTLVRPSIFSGLTGILPKPTLPVTAVVSIGRCNTI